MEAQSKEYVAPLQPSDSYNGARHENFTWSQGISDLDVIVNVPDCLMTANDIRIDVTSTRIKLEVLESCLRKDKLQRGLDEDFLSRESVDEWTAIFNGQLCFPIKKNESIWSLVAGKHISIHLEKCKERWWEALMMDEKKIDIAKIDCSRDFHELDEQEQMKIRELMCNERTKILPRL